MPENKSINSNFLKIIGACENNLKNINLDIPKNKLIVFYRSFWKWKIISSL